jgi:hypothetical protein
MACNITDTQKSLIPEPINFSTYNQDSTLLTGSWEWKRSTYYFTSDGKPGTVTATSANATQQLIISEDGVVREFKNDTLEQVTSLESYLENKLWGVLGDTLAISSAHRDGPENVYLKIQ